jgi:hypothetical protein
MAPDIDPEDVGLHRNGLGDSGSETDDNAADASAHYEPVPYVHLQHGILYG